jgi:hypothetical protein
MDQPCHHTLNQHFAAYIPLSYAMHPALPVDSSLPEVMWICFVNADHHTAPSYPCLSIVSKTSTQGGATTHNIYPGHDWQRTTMHLDIPPQHTQASCYKPAAQHKALQLFVPVGAALTHRHQLLNHMLTYNWCGHTNALLLLHLESQHREST